MGPVLPVIRSLAPLAGSPAGLSACQRAACCSLCSLCAPSALLYAGTFRGRRRSASNRPPPALRVYSGLVDACMRATAARPRQRGARCFNTGSHNRCALECTYACSAAPHRLPGTRERPLEGADHSRVTFGGGDSLAASRRIPRYCSISWLLCYLARMAIRPPRSKMGCNRTIITCGAAKSMAAPRGTGLMRPLNFPRSHSAPLPLTPIAHRT